MPAIATFCVAVFADAPDSLVELRDSLKAEYIRKHRYDYVPGRGKRIDGENAQRGRGVDHDVIVKTFYLIERVAKKIFSAGFRIFKLYAA